MTIQEYISSGIIESYVMGMASEQERAEFELLCSKHPELLGARIDFEKALERKAFANAIEPPGFLKQKIWGVIREDMSSSSTPVIPLHTGKESSRMNTQRWIAAASIILLLACGYFFYTNYQKNQRLKSELARSKQKIEVMDGKARAIEDMISRTEPKQVKVSAPTQITPATINVYWDSTNTDAYLVIDNLVSLPQDQRYEIWLADKGKRTSMGRFESPEDGKIILRLRDGKDADSFAITVVGKDE